MPSLPHTSGETAPFVVVYYLVLAIIGLLGIVFLAIGTKIFKAALFIVGFVIGAGITWSLFTTFNVIVAVGSDRLFLVLFIPFIVGAILGLIVQRLVKAGIFIAGFGIGVFAGTVIVSSITIPLAGWILTLIIFGSSLLLGGAMLFAQSIVITVVSAAFGSYFFVVFLDGLISNPRVYSHSVASLVTYIDSNTIGRIFNVTVDNSTAPAISNDGLDDSGSPAGYIICSFVLVVLFLASAIFQYWFFHARLRKKEQDHQQQREEKQPIIVIQQPSPQSQAAIQQPSQSVIVLNNEAATTLQTTTLQSQPVPIQSDEPTTMQRFRGWLTSWSPLRKNKQQHQKQEESSRLTTDIELNTLLDYSNEPVIRERRIDEKTLESSFSDKRDDLDVIELDDTTQ